MLMMIEKPRPTPAERGLRTLSRAVRTLPVLLDWIVMAPFRALEDRRLLDTLAAMSDHDLHDIGLTRADIYDAALRPERQDASVFLAGRQHRP